MILLPVIAPAVDTISGLARSVCVVQFGLYPFFIPENVTAFVWLVLVALLGALLLSQLIRLSVRLGRVSIASCAAAARSCCFSPWHW